MVGLLIALLAPDSGGKINLIIGILAAVSLIAMLIDLIKYFIDLFLGYFGSFYERSLPGLIK